MAKRGRGRRAAGTPDEKVPLNRQVERLANLLALLLVKGEPQPQKIVTLNASGFGNTEIAKLLGITPNAVTVALYQRRRQ